VLAEDQLGEEERGKHAAPSLSVRLWQAIWQSGRECPQEDVPNAGRWRCRRSTRVSGSIEDTVVGDGAVEDPGNNDVTSGIESDLIPVLVAGVTKALTPDMRSVRRKLREEHVALPCTGQSATAEVDRVEEATGDDQIASGIERGHTRARARRAEHATPHVRACAGKLGEERVVSVFVPRAQRASAEIAASGHVTVDNDVPVLKIPRLRDADEQAA
jgi:hypothetical protein